DVLLAVRGSGEVIGEMALLEDAPRTATVRARTDTRLVAISKQQFDNLLDTSPSAARTLLNTVLARWRETEWLLRQSEKMAPPRAGRRRPGRGPCASRRRRARLQPARRPDGYHGKATDGPAARLPARYAGDERPGVRSAGRAGGARRRGCVEARTGARRDGPGGDDAGGTGWHVRAGEPRPGAGVGGRPAHGLQPARRDRAGNRPDFRHRAGAQDVQLPRPRARAQRG